MKRGMTVYALGEGEASLLWSGEAAELVVNWMTGGAVWRGCFCWQFLQTFSSFTVTWVSLSTNLS